MLSIYTKHTGVITYTKHTLETKSTKVKNIIKSLKNSLKILYFFDWHHFIVFSLFMSHFTIVFSMNFLSICFVTQKMRWECNYGVKYVFFFLSSSYEQWTSNSYCFEDFSPFLKSTCFWFMKRNSSTQIIIVKMFSTGPYSWFGAHFNFHFEILLIFFVLQFHCDHLTWRQHNNTM